MSIFLNESLQKDKKSPVIGKNPPKSFKDAELAQEVLYLVRLIENKDLFSKQCKIISEYLWNRFRLLKSKADYQPFSDDISLLQKRLLMLSTTPDVLSKTTKTSLAITGLHVALVALSIPFWSTAALIGTFIFWLPITTLSAAADYRRKDLRAIQDDVNFLYSDMNKLRSELMKKVSKAV